MPRQPKLPRLSKNNIFEKTFKALHPKQLGLFGEVKQERKKPGKKQIMATAIREAERTAKEFSQKHSPKHRTRIRNGVIAKSMAALFWWPEMFTGERGFASQSSAFTHRKTSKRTGKKITYRGIDASLMSLMNLGMTPQRIIGLTRVILNTPSERFTAAEVGPKNAFKHADRVYKRDVLPTLKQTNLLPPAYTKNADVKQAIDHNIRHIIYLGFMREIGHKKQKEMARKKYVRMHGEETEEEKRHRKAKEREDVKEELEKGLPLEEFIDEAVPKKEKKKKKKKPPKSRFDSK